MKLLSEILEIRSQIILLHERVSNGHLCFSYCARYRSFVCVQLPSKVSPSAGNAHQPQPIEPAPSKAEMPVKVETSTTPNIVEPPAKPHQLQLAPADSQVPQLPGRAVIACEVGRTSAGQQNNATCFAGSNGLPSTLVLPEWTNCRHKEQFRGLQTRILSCSCSSCLSLLTVVRVTGIRHILQAPSNMTGMSDGGMAVSSMPSGPAPSQARLPGATGGQKPPSLHSQPHDSCETIPLQQVEKSTPISTARKNLG